MVDWPQRKLYGFDTDKLICPPFHFHNAWMGHPSVIRDGTVAADAGMKESAAQIDDVLTRWSEDSTEGFDVCVARHGMVVLRKSYGMHKGKAVTQDTMFDLTSTSKMVTGIMLMQLVDQGRLDLDRPITELPGPLHGIKTEKPITLRALYSHTAFSVNFDPSPDLEERLAVVLPHTPIGLGYQYTGTSLELAWALASTASGKSISTFARDHLTGPLECKHTEVFNTGGATRSTAHDLACIWQMVLNRGAYGDKRFFSEKNYEEMLPRRLTQTLGPYTNPVQIPGFGTDRVWGFGTMPWRVRGLSPFTFGHKGYFRSTALIDPIHDLVVIMVRVDPPSGKKYDKYHPQFLEAVVDGLADPVPAFPEAMTLINLEVPPGKDRITIEAVVENPGPADTVLEYRYETEGTLALPAAAAKIKLPAKEKTTVRGRLASMPAITRRRRSCGAVFAAAGPCRRLTSNTGAPHREADHHSPACRQGPNQRWRDRRGRVRPAARRSITLRRTDAKNLSTQRFRVAYMTAVYGSRRHGEGPRTPPPGKARDDAAIKKEDYIELAIDPAGDGKRTDSSRSTSRVCSRRPCRRWQVGRSVTATVLPGDDSYVVEFRHTLRGQCRPSKPVTATFMWPAGGGHATRSGALLAGDDLWDFNSDKHFGVLLVWRSEPVAPKCGHPRLPRAEVGRDEVTDEESFPAAKPKKAKGKRVWPSVPPKPKPLTWAKDIEPAA